MSTEKISYGYVDDTSDDLKSKSGGKFGLNSPAFLTKMELNKNAGAEGSLADAIDITVQVGDKEYRERIYPVNKVYDKDGKVMEESDPKYNDTYNKDWSQKNAVIVHILKCFRTEQEIKTALNVPLASFGDFAELVCSLIPTNAKDVSLDVFLEWQWSINDDQDRTFLQLPKNMKGGYFLCKSVVPVGAWKEIRTDKGMKYMDANNARHPFSRDTNFLESHKGIQQIEGQEAADSALESAATPGQASQGTW